MADIATLTALFTADLSASEIGNLITNAQCKIPLLQQLNLVGQM